MQKFSIFWQFSIYNVIRFVCLTKLLSSIVRHLVGVLANNGPMTTDAALKASHFVQLCSQREIPIVFFQNISLSTISNLNGEQQGHSVLSLLFIYLFIQCQFSFRETRCSNCSCLAFSRTLTTQWYGTVVRHSRLQNQNFV